MNKIHVADIEQLVYDISGEDADKIKVVVKLNGMQLDIMYPDGTVYSVTVRQLR